MKKINYIISLSIFIALPVFAETLEEQGMAIAVEADKRDSGWLDQRVDMLMTLRNARGQESRRHIRNMILEINGDGDKSLSIFDEPHDVKGTAFLSFTHATRADDQWL